MTTNLERKSLFYNDAYQYRKWEPGLALQIPGSKLRNIETDHQCARDKATAVLEKWRDMKGPDCRTPFGRL